jgi:hypothetical protein
MKKYNLWIIVEEHDTDTLATGRRFRDLPDPQVSVGMDFPSVEIAHAAAKEIQKMALAIQEKRYENTLLD